MDTNTKQPYVDKYGILHVPWLRGQTAALWDPYQFELSDNPPEFWRSVDKPRKDGQSFSAVGWLRAAINHWEGFGGHVTPYDREGNVYRIEPRVTDPHELAEHYWELQNRDCWGAQDAFDRGWKSQQWAGNLFKRFGIEDSRVKGLIRDRAEAEWRIWVAEEAVNSPPVSVAHYAPARA